MYVVCACVCVCDSTLFSHVDLVGFINAHQSVQIPVKDYLIRGLIRHSYPQSGLLTGDN